VSHVFSHSANDSAGQSAEVKFDLVHVAPAPVLSRLEGPDDGVTRGVIMLRRVFVLRRVAASNVAADHAKAKMYPDIAHLQAFFTATRVRFDVLNLAGM
jgi:hypothetical protein